MAFHYSPKIVTDGLVLCLDAGNTKSYIGSGTWSDISRGGNNGTLVNGPTFSSLNGGSIVFDGIDDGVNIGSPSKLSLASKISIFAVVSQTTIGSLNTIIGKWGNNTNSFGHNYYFYYNSSGRLSFGFKEEGTSNYLNSVINFIPTLDQIYHVCVTYDTTNSRTFYINGEVYNSYFSDQLTNQTMTTLSTSSVNISSNITENAFYSKNKIYSIQLYNRKLTSNEVLQNYNATKTRYGL